VFPEFQRITCTLCLLSGVVMGVIVPQMILADGNGTPGGVAAIAGQEVEARRQQTAVAQTLFSTGSNAFADQSYGEAMDNFKAAFETLPDAPATATQRSIFFRRYQSATFRHVSNLVEEARWAEAVDTLEVAVELGSKSGLGSDPELKRMLGELQSHDERYNQALSPRHLRTMELVQSKLFLGKGYLDLGDYDRAERSYLEALAADPFNTAARRGLENVERYRMNYYDAAYDHTRSRALAEIAAGWETPVPTLGLTSPIALPGEVAVGGQASIERKLREMVIPRLGFEGAKLIDVLGYLSQTSVELDTAASNPGERGVSIVVNPGTGEDLSQRPITVNLSNLPLGDAIRYATQLVGMKYRVDDFAVIVVPLSDAEDVALVTENFQVPPGFLSGGASAAAGGGGAVDPFAQPDVGAGAGAPVKRVTAQQFLESNGIVFGPGALAQFSASTSTLIVRNTPQQMEIVHSLVLSARDSGDKMVKVNVKIVSIKQNNLREMGLDFLLGQANLGASPSVFFGGGTPGNSGVPVNGSIFPFVGAAGPIGLNPVTSGLRSGNLRTNPSIDDIIAQPNPGVAAGNGAARAPSVFSVAGVFTDPQFQMVVRALSQSKGTDFLCDSYVLTKPGQLAKLEQVREFIYPTEYDPPEIPTNIGSFIIGNTIFTVPFDGTFPVTPATPTAFETRKLGKVIEVEPTVGADNQSVNVNILADFSDFVGFINYGTPITNGNFIQANGSPVVLTPNRILMPVFDAVKETTNVTVWDGQTIAIGGFHGESVTTSNDKVPFIGDLPVLGNAFKSSTSSTTKTALLLFVTVQLIDPGGNPINGRIEDPALLSEGSPPRPLGGERGVPPGALPGGVYDK